MSTPGVPDKELSIQIEIKLTRDFVSGKWMGEAYVHWETTGSGHTSLIDASSETAFTSRGEAALAMQESVNAWVAANA